MQVQEQKALHQHCKWCYKKPDLDNHVINIPVVRGSRLQNTISLFVACPCLERSLYTLEFP